MSQATPCNTIPASTTDTTTPLSTNQLHSALVEKRLGRDDGVIVCETTNKVLSRGVGTIFCKTTGEILGVITRQDYNPEPYDYPAPVARSEYVILEDGSPMELSTTSEAAPKPSADVLQFPAIPKTEHSGGRPLGVVKNPLFAYLTDIFTVTESSDELGWLDDILTGAIHTGPGIISGKYAVSVSGVKRLLQLPEISTATAADKLVNHECNLMSDRQLQRYVEAARVALGGIALYLERHPTILANAGFTTIDYADFWKSRKTDPSKIEAFQLLDQGMKKTEICRHVGVSRPTLDAWIKAR